MTHSKSGPSAAPNTARDGRQISMQLVAWAAGGVLLAFWLFVCVAWQMQIIGGATAGLRFGQKIRRISIPLASASTLQNSRSEWRSRVTVETSGLRFPLVRRGRYLVISWPVPLAGRALHGLTVAWSGPLAKWPASRRFPKLHWRIYHGDLLTRIPQVPGLLRITGGESRTLPSAYMIVKSKVPIFSWSHWSASLPPWQWAMSVFGVQRTRATILGRCVKCLMRSGAAPWTARNRSRAAVAATSAMTEESIFQIAAGCEPWSAKATIFERLSAFQLVWGAGNLPLCPGMIVCPLRHGKLYIYSVRSTGTVYLTHGENEWKWLLFGSSGGCLASGGAVAPADLGLRKVVAHIAEAAGLAAGVPDSLLPPPPAKPGESAR